MLIIILGELLSQDLHSVRCTRSPDVPKHTKVYVKSIILARRVVVCPACPTIPPDDLDLLCGHDGPKQTKDKENQFEGSVVNDPSLMVTTC